MKHCDRSFKGQPYLDSHVQFKHPASAAQNSNSISSAPRNTLTMFVNINNYSGETNMQRMAESQQLEEVPHESAGVAKGQTQRRSNNRRESNEKKSYTVDFIKKTLIFWIHWNHQLISTTKLQSNKESKDRWWLSGEKKEANFLQNWLWTRQRRTQVVQGQWDKGVSLGTDPNTLINILWLPIFYSPYVIGSVMHAFWLVLTYDLLKDRRIDDVIIKTFLILEYIKQIDSKLPYVCSVIDHRERQNVVRTKKWHTRRSRVCHWCSVFVSQGIYLLNRLGRRGVS